MKRPGLGPATPSAYPAHERRDPRGTSFVTIDHARSADAGQQQGCRAIQPGQLESPDGLPSLGFVDLAD